MKKNEAKSKVCPHPGMGTCVASNCMMWESDYKSISERIEHKALNYSELQPILNNQRYGDYNYARKVDGVLVPGFWDKLTWIEDDSGDCGLKTKECNCEH